jgi:hypothetical protein
MNMERLVKMVEDGKIKIGICIRKPDEPLRDWIMRSMTQKFQVKGIELSEAMQKQHIAEALDFGLYADICQCDSRTNKNLEDNEIVCYNFYFYNKNTEG